MKLKKIKLKNIRSYEEQEIEFPDGSLLLSGDIGSGKTSILLAIEYALFGLQPGQKGSALLRNNASLGEVSLELEIAGREVIIERRLKRESKAVSNDYSAITLDGEKKEYSITELKSRIINLLHYPPEFIKKNNILYKYTIYTPQEQMKQIILEDSEARLNVLGYVFGIDKYKRIRENLTILLNRLKEDSKLLQGEIKALEEEKAKLKIKKDLILDLESKIIKKQEEFKENLSKRKSIENEILKLEKKVKERETFEKEADKAKIMIASKKDNLLVLDKERSSLLKNISEHGVPFKEENLIDLVKKISLQKEEMEKLNSTNLELSSKIKALEHNKKSVLDKKNRVFQIEMCPTCLQNVPHAHKHNILNEAEKEINELTKLISSLEEERKLTKSLLDKAKLGIISLEEEKTRMEILKSKSSFIEKSKSRLEEINKIKESLERDIVLLSSHLDTMKESILEFSKFNNLLKAKSEELSRAFNQEKNSEIAVAELKKELELTNKEILQIMKVVEEKEASKKKLMELLELSSWLSTQFLGVVNFIERNVMLKLRIEFSRLFSKWFHTLAGESFDVHIDENFTPLVVQNESEMDYAFLSGGERTAVALAYRLALNQTINSILSNIRTKDIIILDEPTDGFSDLQLDKMREVLTDLNVPQLIIVSHEQKIEGFVDNVIRLKKEGNISSIEESQNNQKT